MSAPTTTGAPLPALTAEHLGEVLALLPGSDSVELKAPVPGADRRRVVQRLGMDPLAAELRQVASFDTPDLGLNGHGVVVRARRIQGKAGDTVIKLRPINPADLSEDLRSDRAFGVEVDAMPGGYVCSASMKGTAKDKKLREVFRGETPARALFSAPHGPRSCECTRKARRSLSCPRSASRPRPSQRRRRPRRFSRRALARRHDRLSRSGDRL